MSSAKAADDNSLPEAETVTTADFKRYLRECDGYAKTVIYSFARGDGGIGDFIKFFVYILQVCVRRRHRLLLANSHAELAACIQLAHPAMRFAPPPGTQVRAAQLRVFDWDCDRHMAAHPGVTTFVVRPYACYKALTDITRQITLPVREVFRFSPDVLGRAARATPELPERFRGRTPRAIHLRLGDKFLETDARYVVVKGDTRAFSQAAITRYIEEHADEPILFFCDNRRYKERLCEKYDNLFMTSCEVGHTSLGNTSNTAIVDAAAEFCILCDAPVVVAASNSGFSLVAAKYKPDTTLVRL